MSIARIDVNDYDDTELGAEVRALYAAGRTIISLIDGKASPDTRAATWTDGWHGLYRLRCERGDVWLSAVTRGFPKRYVQGYCPSCGAAGIPMEDS